MFKRLFEMARSLSHVPTQRPPRSMIESLEDRRLLSAGFMPAFRDGHFGGGFGGPGLYVPMMGMAGGIGIATIHFDQAPTAVQTGLTTLVGSAPSTTQTIYLANVNGVETYSLTTTGAGTVTRYTVDQNGKAVTQPTQSSTTFGEISNTAVTGEINAIATGLNLTAPASTTTVSVSTAADGTSVYTIRLPSANSTRRGLCGAVVSVDSNGNPVGNQRLPLNVLSTAVQTGLTTNAPADATALTPTSLVDVRTANGVTFYSALYKGTGATSLVTVNTTGELTDLPSVKQIEFSTIPAAAQTELQTLATAAGVAGTISTTQAVLAYNEGNGTIIYSVKLSTTITTTSGRTLNRPVTLSVDQAGNPTVPPAGNFRIAPPIRLGADKNPGTTTSSTTKASSSVSSSPKKRVVHRRRHGRHF